MRASTIATAALLLVPPAVGAADPTGASPLAHFGWLADLAASCWTGTDAEGRTTDRQCYSVQYDRFLRGTIELFAGDDPGERAFQGDSIFAWDPKLGRVVYTYWGSAGQVGRAEAHFDLDRLVFPGPAGADGDSAAPRSVWERLDAGSFRVTRERRAGDRWHPEAVVVYRRDAAAPVDGGGGPAADTPLAALGWLAGSCWTGTFQNGTTRDHVCYDWRWGGTWLRSRHRVTGGAGPYEGETWIGWNSAAGRLEFNYFNSPGGVVRGAILPTADGLAFPDETVEMGGRTTTLRSRWTRDGENRYVATTKKLDDGEWQSMMRIEFVRSGPASDWVEAD
jgi:hypothetical protein